MNATTETRFHAALAEIRSNGITVNFNVEGCCPGCAASEMTVNTNLCVWTYQGQEEFFSFIDGNPRVATARDDICFCESYPIQEMIVDDNGEIIQEEEYEWYECDLCTGTRPDPTPRPVHHLYVRFGDRIDQGRAVEAGQIAYDALIGQGFTLEWDGTADTAITVEFDR